MQTQNFTSRQVRVVLSHWQEPSVIILSVCSGETCCIKNQNCPQTPAQIFFGGSRDCHIWCMDISPIFTVLKSLVLQNLTKVSTNWLICCQHADDVLQVCCKCAAHMVLLCAASVLLCCKHAATVLLMCCKCAACVLQTYCNTQSLSIFYLCIKIYIIFILQSHDKTYNCDVCGTSFGRKDVLTKHKKTHENGK